jgi:2-dehydropantoate 2-reductase
MSSIGIFVATALHFVRAARQVARKGRQLDGGAVKFGIVGGGGVGGYLAARLKQAGHEVAVLARGANLAALRARGLHVSGPLGNVETGPLNASDDARELGPAEAVIVTTKMYDLESVARQAAPMAGPGAQVIPVQNGVEAHEILARALPGAKVLKGTIYVSSFLVGPGTILLKSPFCRLKIAAASGPSGDDVQRVAAALNDPPRIEAAVAPDIDLDLWRKFAMLAPFSSVACLARVGVGPVLGDPALMSQLKEAIGEVAAVARAKKVMLPPDIEAATIAQMRQFPGDAKPSMLEDLEAGRPLEVDYLAGAVVRFGKALGVPTPVHAKAYQALAPFAAGARRG